MIEPVDDWMLREIEIGPSNNNHVVVVDGLTVGERVSLTPFRHIQRNELPESAAEFPRETDDESVVRAMDDSPAFTSMR